MGLILIFGIEAMKWEVDSERVVFIPQIHICLKCPILPFFSHVVTAWEQKNVEYGNGTSLLWVITTGVKHPSTGYHPVIRWFPLCEKSVSK